MIACPETIAFNRDGWTWRLRDSSALDPWFDDFLDGRIEEPLRSTPGKDVFRVVSYERPLIVRCYHPKRAFSKLKSRVAPKAKDEYESYLLLEDLEVPAAECLGWGRRGPDSVIIAKEIPNSMNARDFWFANVMADEANLRQPYLVEFARFLGLFISSGLFHPDLRLNKLLVSGSPFMFHVAEPYGIVKPNALEDSMKIQMARIIGELRGEINVGEAAAMLMFSGVEQDARKVVGIWRGILKEEAAEVEAEWPKRRRQIIACDPRFCVSSEGLVMHCAIDGSPLLPPDELSASLLEKLDRKDFNDDPVEALRLWLVSYKLMFHRIRHRAPLLMETDSNGKPVALHFERRRGAPANGQPCVKEFIDNCVTAGIEISDLEDNIEVIDGKAEITDVSKLSLEA